MTNTITVLRGLETNRSGQTPDAGEPLWTTDGKKLYVGDGSTAGAILIGPGATEGINDLDDVTVTTAAAGEVLTFTGSGDAMINETFAEAGIQAQDTVLDEISGVGTVADNEVLIGTGAGTYAHETGATLHTSLGLAIGTDVQAFDTDTAKLDVAQSWAAVQTFKDTLFELVDDGDVTKKAVFQASGIANATTRIITLADENIDMTPTTGSYLGATAAVDGGTF